MTIPDTPQLEIVVRADRIEIGERTAGLLTGLQNVGAGYDLAGLTEYLQRIKAKYPDMLDATILMESDVSYDVLVQVMDAVRVFEATRDGKRIRAELFPEISIGDAPLAAREG